VLVRIITSVFLLCGASKCFSTVWCYQVLGIYFSFIFMFFLSFFVFIILYVIFVKVSLDSVVLVCLLRLVWFCL